jgi:hypothetical protein
MPWTGVFLAVRGERSETTPHQSDTPDVPPPRPPGAVIAHEAGVREAFAHSPRVPHAAGP